MFSQPDLPEISQLISLKDKRAIVTGGARGLGLAIAYRLAEAGATVVVADVDGEASKTAAESLAEKGFKALSAKCDVSSEQDVKKMVEFAGSQMGGIDILVNNAGIFPRISLQEMTAADFDSVISINLRGTFLCSREVSRLMIEQRSGGSIINLASIDAVHPSEKGLTAYDASKGAVLTLTKSLALELGQHDIRVNAIAPGGILTESLASLVSGSPSTEGKAQLKKFMARMVLGRMGRADEVARVALFLAGEMSSYITGALITVDGGYLIS
jgi:NAD(P)-dependent dehydrogenase (short-subunit alcohol dehydrogenase family)